MSEMDIAESEGFLDEVLLCLPILGVNAFSVPEQVDHANEVLHLKGPDTIATGYETSDGFVVSEGSHGRASTTPSMHSYIDDIRQSLINREILSQQGSQLSLQQDYPFNSPSQAAAVMLGRNANGRIEWKSKSGETLKEIQEKGL